MRGEGRAVGGGLVGLLVVLDFELDASLNDERVWETASSILLNYSVILQFPYCIFRRVRLMMKNK